MWPQNDSVHLLRKSQRSQSKQTHPLSDSSEGFRFKYTVELNTMGTGDFFETQTEAHASFYLCEEDE